MSLEMIVELLKNVPVLLNRSLPFWLVSTKQSGFKSHLSRVLIGHWHLYAEHYNKTCVANIKMKI